MTFGVTEDGLSVPRLTDIREEIEASERELFGPTLDLSDESVEGQVNGIIAERFAVLWELLEVLYGALDPDAASGALLDAMAALSGTTRRAATYSAVTLTLTGTPTTVIPGASLASTGNESAAFQTVADATIALADTWVDAATYNEGDIISAGGNIYRAGMAVPDTIAVPLHTIRGFASIPSDPSAFWAWLGAGTGYVDALARSTVTGPVFAPAYGIEVIDTPISGWDGAVNLADVTPGAVVQSDEDLRLTREVELASLGVSPRDALRGRLLKVGLGTANPVTAVTVFHNVTDVTDADGVLPHSVEALVQGGEDEDIYAALWANVASGIRTVGTEVGSIIDSQGRTQPVSFSRPVEVQIYVVITLVKDVLEYPDDGDEQVKAAIATYGATQACGKDAVASALSAQAFKIPGVLNVMSVFIGIAPGPSSSATIPISLRELAVFDTAKITVTTSDGVP